jgi:hypothetical protein
MRTLANVIDPLSYRDYLTMPKLVGACSARAHAVLLVTNSLRER